MLIRPIPLLLRARIALLMPLRPWGKLSLRPCAKHGAHLLQPQIMLLQIVLQHGNFRSQKAAQIAVFRGDCKLHIFTRNAGVNL